MQRDSTRKTTLNRHLKRKKQGYIFRKTITGLQHSFIGKYCARSLNSLFTDIFTYTAVISATD